MLNITILPPIKGGQEAFRKVERITVNGEISLTSEHVAEFYGCTTTQIKQNFNNNKERFSEGEHYFKLEGEELQKLRVENFDLQISPMTRTLYLWTRGGVLRHCKMLNTDKAWKVFEKMEYTFFLFADGDFAKLTKELRKEYNHLESMWLNLHIERLNLERERHNLEYALRNLINAKDDKNIAKAKVFNYLARSSTDDKLRNDLIRQAAKLLLREDS